MSHHWHADLIQSQSKLGTQSALSDPWDIVFVIHKCQWYVSHVPSLAWAWSSVKTCIQKKPDQAKGSHTTKDERKSMQQEAAHASWNMQQGSPPTEIDTQVWKQSLFMSSILLDAIGYLSRVQVHVLMESWSQTNSGILRRHAKAACTWGWSPYTDAQQNISSIKSASNLMRCFTRCPLQIQLWLNQLSSWNKWQESQFPSPKCWAALSQTHPSNSSNNSEAKL